MKWNNFCLIFMQNLSPQFMSRIIFASIILSFFVLISCRKKTRADFEFNQIEYSAGDTLDFKIKRKNKNCIWTIGQDTYDVYLRQDTSKPTFILPYTMPDGIYALRVSDNFFEYSDGLRNEELFVVKTKRATLEVQVSGNGPANFTVNLDFQSIGSSENGTLEKEIPLGLYYLRVFDEDDELIHGETVHLENEGALYTVYV
jgi:hypothetical protein